MKVTGTLAAVGIAVVVSLGGATSASAHSGGLDKYGCHAGSQPYHCHRGGSGGSSGGTSGGGTTTPNTIATVPSGPSAAELAAIDNAESAVDRSRNELARERKRVDTVSNKLATAKQKLEAQREDVDALRAEVSELEETADRLRAERIEERAAAAQRVRLVAASNQGQLEAHKTDRRTFGYLAGLFGGFLLLGFVRRLATALTLARPLVLLGGLVASIVLGVIGFAMSWAPGGILVSLVAGVLLSGVFMLARVWWVAFRLPKVVGFALLGLAAFMAIGSLGVAMSATPPTAESPAAEDAAMVAEQEVDPDAEEFAPAVEAEQQAEDLASGLEELDAGLDAQQAKIDALGVKLDKAEERVETKQAEVEDAKDYLETLR